MTTDQQLRSQYDDFLEADDDARFLQAVRDLQSLYPARRPPAVLYHRIAPSLKQHEASAHPRRLPLPNFRLWRGRRLSVAALILALAGITVGTTGLATAAIDTVRTHLFSNPPPSPEAAVWVGSMEIPMWGGCALRPTTAPVTAPDGRQFAQLYPVPSGLAGSVSAVFTPCQPAPPPPRAVPTLPPSPYEWETVRTISVVRYQGSEGSVQVTTGQATAEGMKRGLYLGNPVGTLPDGSRAFDLVCSSGCAYRDNIRWMKDGLIVNVSGDMPVDRLKEMASDVTLK